MTAEERKVFIRECAMRFFVDGRDLRSASVSVALAVKLADELDRYESETQKKDFLAPCFVKSYEDAKKCTFTECHAAGLCQAELDRYENEVGK